MHQEAHGLVSQPIWKLGSPNGRPTRREHELTSSDFVTDVCVIGGGIAGLTTAYQCVRSGLRVVLIEAGTLGSGETLRTSAHLASALDDRFQRLEAHHGAAKTALLRESHAAAIDWIEDFCASHAPTAAFRRVQGYLFASAADEEPEAFLDEECAAAVRAGLDASLVRVPHFGAGALETALRFEGQAEFDVGAYLTALASAYLENGGVLWEETRVLGVEEGELCRVDLEGGGVVRARDVVVTTNAPITSQVSLPLRQAAYRSYVIALDVPRDAVLPGLYWDTEDPYHYVRSLGSGDASRDVLLVGGEDHRTGQEHDPEARLQRLEAWARERFPFAGGCTHRWSGQILEPFDGVGFVGKSPGHQRIHVITGDSGNGLTLGTLGAKLLRDQIVGLENPWAAVYDPSRPITSGLSAFVGENATSVSTYLDYAKPSEVRSVNELEPGEGGVLRDGLRLLAVCRDREGVCHEHSAVCPHLGAIVHWNALEQSWDCPCHGSRFDTEGRVITGPSTRDLEPVVRDGNEQAAE